MLCLDRPADRRRFMQYSHSNGYTTDEFLFLIPHFVSDANTSEPWVDYSENKDGLDEMTKAAYHKALIVRKIRIKKVDKKKLFFVCLD